MSSLAEQLVGHHRRLTDPRAEIATGWILAGLFVIFFVAWGTITRMDAAAHASGQLIVAGQRQSVQHRDGGVVGEILVQEAQRVKRGQLLIRLAASDVRAQERVLAAQEIRLLAQRARLDAEQAGARRLTTPIEFAGLPEEDRGFAVRALAMQQAELDARAATLGAQRAMLGQRAAQSDQQGRGYDKQTAATQEQLRLIDDQLKSLRPLAEKGFVSRTRLRELERQEADLRGREGQYVASVAQSADARREMQYQSLEAQRSYRERTTTELREVEDRLGEILPRLVAARDALARTEIRAPASGTVVGLTAFTPGGVVAPGQKLMDIVPDRLPLIVQAKFSIDDADDLEVGQATRVRFPALHDRTAPDLAGKLTKLSADSFTEDKTGQRYYLAEVEIPRDQLDQLRAKRGGNFEFRAGMPAEILVPTRKRSLVDYLLEPLTVGLWGAFREH